MESKILLDEIILRSQVKIDKMVGSKVQLPPLTIWSYSSVAERYISNVLTLVQFQLRPLFGYFNCRMSPLHGDGGSSVLSL